MNPEFNAYEEEIARKLQAIQPPELLREQILVAMKNAKREQVETSAPALGSDSKPESAESPIMGRRVFFSALTMAAAAMLLAMFFVFTSGPSSLQAVFSKADFSRKALSKAMCYFCHKGDEASFQAQLISSDLSKINQWLTENQYPSFDSAISELQSMSIQAVTTVIWHGKPVSVLALKDANGQDAYLSLVNADVPGAETFGDREVKTEHGISSSVWAQNGNTLALAAPVKPIDRG